MPDTYCKILSYCAVAYPTFLVAVAHERGSIGGGASYHRCIAAAWQRREYETRRCLTGNTNVTPYFIQICLIRFNTQAYDP